MDLQIPQPSVDTPGTSAPLLKPDEKIFGIVGEAHKSFLETHSRLEAEYQLSKKNQAPIREVLESSRFSARWLKLRGAVRFLTVMRSAISRKRLLGLSADIEQLSQTDLSVRKFEQICQKIAGKLPSSEKSFRPRQHFIIYPDGFGNRLLSAFHLLLTSYTLIYYPFKMGYLGHERFMWFDLCFDFLTLLHIFLSFRRAFISKVTLVDDFRHIAVRYLKTFFILDLLSIVPIWAFDFGMRGSQADNLSSLLKLVRYLRLPHLFRDLSTNYIINRLKGFLDINKRIQQLINFCIFVVLFLHVLACLMTYITTLENRIENLLTRGFLIDWPYNPFGTYLVSIYFLVTVLCTVGFGDVVPITTLEKAVTCVLIFVGMSFFAYTLATLSNVLSASNINLSIVSHRFTFLNAFASEKPIDQKLLEKITLNLEYFEEIEDVDNSELSRNFLMSISLDLTYDIAKHIHKDLIQKILFFQNKDINFLSQLIPFFKPRKFQEKELIYEFGDYPTFVYFLLEGRVEFANTLGKVFKQYIYGAYFGEIEVLKGCLRQFSARAQTAVEVLMLPREVFMSQIESYPEVKNEIYQTAMRRDIVNKRAMLLANRLHHMNGTGRQGTDEESAFQILKERCEKNVAQFKERTMQAVMEASVDPVEKYLARGDGEGQAEASKKEKILELEQRSILHSNRLSPFLVTQSNDFNFRQVFRRLMESAEEGRFCITKLENLFKKNVPRIRRRKYKMEEGIQATPSEPNGPLLLGTADLSLDKNPHPHPGKSAFHSQGSLHEVARHFDGHRSEVYAKRSRRDFKDSCAMIEEELQEDDCEDEAREKYAVSFVDAETRPAVDWKAYDQFASKEVELRHIRLHRRDVLPREANPGESGSSHSSVPEM